MEIGLRHARPSGDFSRRRALKTLFGKYSPRGLEEALFLELAAGRTGRSGG